MIAKDNEYFTEASNTLCDLYANFNVRERCRDREDYEVREKYIAENPIRWYYDELYSDE